jgi:sec-independent protein translocase protein TatA
MGPLEVLLILALALIVFGPDRLPELARQVGRTVMEVRRITSDLTTEVNRSLQLEEPQSPPSRAPVVRPVPPPITSTQSPKPTVTASSHDDLRPPY